MILLVSLSITSLILVIAFHFIQRLVRKSAASFLYPKRRLASNNPKDFGIQSWEEVVFCSSDGLKLEGWFIPATIPGKATIIYTHGIRGNRSALLSQASHLVKAGYGALLFDLRNHGSSQGQITTMTSKEVFDVEGALGFLQSRADVDSNNIGIMGHSLGAATAIRASARLNSIKFVVAQAAFADLCRSMHQAARSLSGLATHNRLVQCLMYPLVCLIIDYAQKQVGEKASNISPLRDLTQIKVPCLFIHGRRDQTIDVSNSQDLYHQAPGPKELLLLEHSEHSSISSKDMDSYISGLLRFVEQHGSSTASVVLHSPVLVSTRQLSA